MVVLPTSLPASRSWAFVDFLNVQLRSDPAAGGVATLDAGQLDPAEMWLLHHMVASCDSTTATRLRLYESAPDPLRILDGTDTGNFDVADWSPGLQVRPSSTLVAVWTGASNGARGVLTLQGHVMRQG